MAELEYLRRLREKKGQLQAQAALTAALSQPRGLGGVHQVGGEVNMGGGGGGSGYITGALTMTSSGEETATAKRTPTTTATGAPNNTSPGVGGFSGASRPGVNGFDGAVKITITGTY